MIETTSIFPVFSFTKPTMLNEVAALEILQDHSVYYKVRFVILIIQCAAVVFGFGEDESKISQDLILLLWIIMH